MSDAVLAIDIGGTKLAVGLVSAEGALLRRAQVPTSLEISGDELYDSLLQLIDSVADTNVRERLVGCGVGCGGPMSPGGETVSPLNIRSWREFPLRAKLSAALGMPVTVDNDAKALALAEGWLGAAQGVANYLAMVVSTGVGGGLVVDGRLLDGASGNAGHIGHVVVVPDGSACACGGYGCLEAEISGSGILRRTGLRAEEVSVDERVRAGRLLGLALAGTVALLDLSVVAVGGSVALGFGAPFFTAAQTAFARHAGLDFAHSCRITPVGLGAEAPLIGAGAIGWRSVSQSL